MLDKLNQPKGSTIGVLRDGRTIQEAFDQLDPVVSLSSTVSLATAVARLQITGGTIVVPAGTWEVPNLLNVPPSIQIIGRGNSSILKQPASSTSKGVLQFVLNNPTDSVRVDNLSIVTERPYQADNIALRVDLRPQLSGDQIANRNVSRGSLTNLSIRGSTARTDGVSFGIGIDLVSTGWITLDNIHVIGSSSTATPYGFRGVGICQRGDGKPVETIIRGLRALSLEYAYLCPEYTEGVYLTDAQAVNCKWAVVVSPVADYVIGTLGQVGGYHFVVDQAHVNVSQGGIFLSKCRYSFVSNVMALLDDHSVSSAVLTVHLRDCSYCNVNAVTAVSYNLDGTTGITRQVVVLNNTSDSFVGNISGRTEGTQYENLTNIVRLVNTSQRNEIEGVKGSNANEGISVGAGCGQNSIAKYRFSNVTAPVVDEAGDLNRGNTAAHYETVTPPASSQEVTLEIVPRGYFSRRPQGFSYTITTPTNTSFPIVVFYDRDSSTSTKVVLKVKPGVTGNNLPTVMIGISITLHD